MDARQNLKDYYYILGVSPEATLEEIEEAYHGLYDKFGPHVTVTEHDTEVMERAYRDICEAWEVLSDPFRRQQYDKHNLPLVQKSQLRTLWGKFTGVQDNDLKGKDNAPDFRVPLEITLKEAVKGAQKSIKIEDALPCQQCLRKKPMERLKCLNCHGVGSIRNDRTEEITVPPGVHDKMELRRPGKGKYEPRLQKYGDLVFEIQIQTHPFFILLGQDLTCTAPVTVYEAVLGAEIEVPTATGKVVMRIQPLTQNGRVYRLKGLGLAGADLLVTIEVVMPKQLSADEVVLFRKLNDCSTLGNPRAEIFAKLAALHKEQN